MVVRAKIGMQRMAQVAAVVVVATSRLPLGRRAEWAALMELAVAVAVVPACHLAQVAQALKASSSSNICRI